MSYDISLYDRGFLKRAIDADPILVFVRAALVVERGISVIAD